MKELLALSVVVLRLTVGTNAVRVEAPSAYILRKFLTEATGKEAGCPHASL
jgi:hypothetical protein